MSRESKQIILLTAGLLALGIIMLFSATAIWTGETSIANPNFYLVKQFTWIYISVLAMVIALHIPYTFWGKIRYPLIGIALLLLIAVLVPGIGTEVNGARRWIRLRNLGIQPSEMARLSLIIFLSGYLAVNQSIIGNFKKGLLLPLVVIFSCCSLVLVEPDVGMTIFIGISSAILLIAGRARLRHLLPILGVAFILISIVAIAKSPYIRGRITSFMNSQADPLGKGHQLRQSLVALGSGGLTGVGLGESTQKLFFLPEVQSDSIFPIIGEELGFLGAGYVILAFLMLIFISWNILRRTVEPFGALLALAITVEIVLQAIINIASATGLIPTKGMPLPFISFGGSSLFFTMVKIGILINISERNRVREDLALPDSRYCTRRVSTVDWSTT